MQHLLAQVERWPVDEQVGVDALVRIARVPAVEKPRHAVALQAAVLHFLAEHEVAAADGVGPVIERPFERAQDLVAQLRRHALVGVDDEDPVVRGAVDGVVLLRGRAEVLALLDADPGKLLAHALDRAVGGERVDEVDLVGPFDGAEALLDLLDLVEGVDDRGHGRARHGAHSRISAAWPTNLRSSFSPPRSLQLGGCGHQTGGDRSPLPTTRKTLRYTVLMSTNKAGTQAVSTSGDTIMVDLRIQRPRARAEDTHRHPPRRNGIPLSMDTTGNDYYKVAIEERFSTDGNTARWKNTSESGDAAAAPLFSSMYGPPEELACSRGRCWRDGDGLRLLPGGPRPDPQGWRREPPRHARHRLRDRRPRLLTVRDLARRPAEPLRLRLGLAVDHPRRLRGRRQGAHRRAGRTRRLAHRQLAARYTHKPAESP